MKHKLIDKGNATHYMWGENSDAWVLTKANGLSVKLVSMPACSRREIRFTEEQHFFFILSSNASFYFGNRNETVKSNQGFLIQPKSFYSIANETLDDLEFLVFSRASTDNNWSRILDHFSLLKDMHIVK